MTQSTRYARRWSRRRVLGTATGGAAALSLAALGVGCGGDDDAGGNGDSPVNLPTVAAPTSEPKRGGVVNLATNETFPHLDLHRHIAPTLTQVASLTTNRLLRHKTDPSVRPTDYELEGDAAESWEQADELTLILKLRPGITWQDRPPVNGRPLVAQDVIAVFDRQRTKQPEFIYSYLFDWIDSMTAPDDQTIVIKAKQPTFRGPGTLALRELPILSIEAIEAAGSLETVEAWVGIGPFILKEWQKDVAFTFERNPNYWEGNGLPYLDGVVIRQIPDASSRLSAFLAGEIDQIEGIEPELVSTVKSSRSDARIYTFSAVGGQHFAWTVKGDSPFRDPRVRRAWSLLIDRQGMSSALNGDQAEIRISPLSPGFTNWARSQDEIKADDLYDVAEAKRLLEAAGYPDGFTTKLMGRANNASINAWVEWAVRQGKQVGIEIQPDTVESTVYLQAQRDHNFAHGQVYSIRAYDDPDEYLYPLFHTGASKNYFETADPELDALIQKQRGVLAAEERRAILQEIDRRWTTDFNYHTFVNTLFRNDAIANRVQNHQVRVVTEYSQLRYAWLES